MCGPTSSRHSSGAIKRVLINLHGGGFISDSGSLIEGVPIAKLAGIKVVSVYYSAGTGKSCFLAAVDDVVAVYKELLEDFYAPKSIGIFGTSAGAILTAEAAVRFKQLRAARTRRARNFFRHRRLQPEMPVTPARFFFAQRLCPGAWSQSIPITCPTINMSPRPIAKTLCSRRSSSRSPRQACRRHC